MPFCILKEQFLLANKLNIPNSFNNDEVYLIETFKQEDNEFEKAWVKYHNDNAKLQILCTNCNLSKGSKN